MSFRLLPPAVSATACLIAALAASAGEIPVYEDFSVPLSFADAPAASGVAGENALPARDEIAVSFLAQEEDTWFDRLLVRHPAAAAAPLPYTPPQSGSTPRENASARNWLSDAVTRSRGGQPDATAENDDAGEWLSGDLARMARKRAAASADDRSREDAGDNDPEEETATPWTQSDPTRFPRAASADATGGGGTNAPGSRSGDARAALTAGRTSADARERERDDFAGNGPEEPSRVWTHRDWTGAAAADIGAGTAPWKVPSAEESGQPSWMKAILAAGDSARSVQDTPSSSASAVPSRGFGMSGAAEGAVAANGGLVGRAAAGSAWESFSRNADAAAPALTAQRAGTGGWGTPSAAAGGRGGWTGGWHGGWTGGQSLSGSFALPADSAPPLPASSRPSVRAADAVLPRPSWY